MKEKHITWMIILIMLSGAGEAALGISPANLDYGKVLKGGDVQKEFKVYNTGEEQIQIRAYAKDECALWFEFEPESAAIEPGGGLKVTATASPPEDTASGTYRCTLYVTPGKDESIEGEFIMGVSGGAATIASLEVTGEQILGGSISRIETHNVEEGNPVLFEVEYENTGNVRAKPVTQIEIIKDAKTVDEITETHKSIRPGEKQSLEIRWNTEGRELGRYAAQVRIELEDEVLADERLEFSILEPGTFQKQGRIIDEKIERNREIGYGEMIELEIEFQNIGELDIQAAINGLVFYEDKLIDVMQSNLVLVEVNETETLTAYYKPEYTGKYLIRGEVVYEGKRINFGSIEYMVGEKPETEEENQTMAIAIPILLVAALLLHYGWRRIKR